MFGTMHLLAVVGPMEVLIVYLMFIIGLTIPILLIILFFKMWRMCNDVREIKETLSSKDKTEVC